jgi:predicted GNAT superfamily acetyltransferase
MEQIRSGQTRESIEVRECTTVDEFEACVRLQREAFGFADIELSPRRHLIVSRRAGGFTLGAFSDGELIGFVHQMVAVREPREIIGYSHMMAVRAAYQNRGVGALLKWKQRAKSLAQGESFITWTWDPMQARNAHFNINRLGVAARSYAVNFYGTGYSTSARVDVEGSSIDSDRLFADWDLYSPRVVELAEGREPQTLGEPRATIAIPHDWQTLVKEDARAARREQLRVRVEFEEAFAAGLVCAGFKRDAQQPRYLLYNSDV